MRGSVLGAFWFEVLGWMVLGQVSDQRIISIFRESTYVPSDHVDWTRLLQCIAVIARSPASRLSGGSQQRWCNYSSGFISGSFALDRVAGCGRGVHLVLEEP